jgi:hypothetical protein
MQSHRILSGLTILIMVVVVAAGYLLVAQPQLAAAGVAGEQLVQVNTQIAATQATIAALQKEQKKLPELKSQLASLRSSIPNDAQVSRYIDDLNALAGASGLAITGLKVDTAEAYKPPVVAPVAGAPTATSTPSPSASATAAPAVVAPVAPLAWTPTTDASITPANFVAIPVVIVTAGTLPTTLTFIKGLQTGARLFLVTGIETTTGADNPGAINATINGYIYVIIDEKGAAIATTTSTAPATPTPTATPTATPSPSGTATPTPTQSPTPTKKP